MQADYPARLVSAVVVPINVENDSNESFFVQFAHTIHTYCVSFLFAMFYLF